MAIGGLPNASWVGERQRPDHSRHWLRGVFTRPGAATGHPLTNDPLPICYGRPKSTHARVVHTGRCATKGDIRIGRVLAVQPDSPQPASGERGVVQFIEQQ